MRTRLLPPALAAALLALAGCGGGGSARLPIACPTPGILADGADLTRYQPGQVQDLTSLTFDARLAGLEGGCRPGRNNESVLLSLTPSFTIERGAASTGRVLELPWFAAVVGPNEEVLSRQEFVERIAFGRNETRSSGKGAAVSLTLPAREGVRVSDYRILVSFALTAEELALNRRRGPR